MTMGHDGRINTRRARNGTRCEFERSLQRGEYCAEMEEVRLDGLLLCGRHADQLRLEEQAACCKALLLHMDLWLEVARRRGKEDVGKLLEAEHAKGVAALRRVDEELVRTRGSKGSGVSGSGSGSPLGGPLLFVETAKLGRPPP